MGPDRPKCIVTTQGELPTVQRPRDPDLDSKGHHTGLHLTPATTCHLNLTLPTEALPLALPVALKEVGFPTFNHQGQQRRGVGLHLPKLKHTSLPVSQTPGILQVFSIDSSPHPMACFTSRNKCWYQTSCTACQDLMLQRLAQCQECLSPHRGFCRSECAFLASSP